METILQRSKEFVSSISSYAVGRIKDKVKAGQLYQAKDAIYWWAMRFIPDFPAIFPQWNREMMALIQLTAVSEDLSVAFRPKNNLGDLELAMFFSTIRRETVGVDNWQQHFVAWILSYITAARPGSFTVGPGYKKGASLGLQTTKVRVEDETLRWQHCQWFYIGDSIGVRVRSHFTKGYRNPHSSSNRDGTRVFTFLPTKSSRHEFDLSLLLFGIAHKRGLFVDSLEQLLSGTSTLKTNPTIAAQAVFDSYF